MAGELAAVETEAQRRGPIDQAAAIEAEGLARSAARLVEHQPASPAVGRGRARAGSTALIACVRVSRVTTSQLWQPAV